VVALESLFSRDIDDARDAARSGAPQEFELTRVKVVVGTSQHHLQCGKQTSCSHNSAVFRTIQI
jgi:hypothetical protein